MGMNWKSWAAAYHEAGHAVIRHLRGYAIGDVWIGTDGSGYCGVERGEGELWHPEDDLLISLGGYAGEVRAWWYTGEVHDLQTFLTTCPATDLVCARQTVDVMVRVGWVGAKSPAVVLEHHWHWARDLLRQHHDVHRDFAVALRKRRRFRPGAAEVLIASLMAQYGSTEDAD